MFDDYAVRSHYQAVEQWLGSPEFAGRVALFRIGSKMVTEAEVAAWLNDWR